MSTWRRELSKFSSHRLTAMGGLGRQFDGSCAEYTRVPTKQVRGAFVAATTRNPDREKLLRANGVDQVFVDTGTIAKQAKKICSGGVDKVLELVASTTLKDSLRCTKQRGIVCMTGIVGEKWSFDNFSPMEAIPTAVCLTTSTLI